MFKKCHFSLIFCIVLNVASEKWYSASLTDKGSFSEDQLNFMHDNYKQFNTNYTQITIIHKNPKNSIKHPSKPKLTLPKYKQPLSKLQSTPNIENTSITNMTKPKPTVVKTYNNTINNINIIRKIRPKRKFVKRCPAAREKKDMHESERSKKFLEVFQVVEFKHEVCQSTSGLDGTCLPEQHCVATGGTPMGSCADGYGTCCVNQFSCEDVTQAITGWLVNPGFPEPSTERLSCSLTIKKASAAIRQIRLDFLNFELLAPTEGTCEQDQFVITGQNVNNKVPTLCGINTGQHMYIEVGETEGPITISVQTVTSEKRLFAIKINQLSAFDELAAPTGCLQYFKEAQGHIESFNFKDKSDIGIARYPSYLNNMNYAMCIERTRQSCSITYTNEGYFQIVNYDTDGLPVIPPNQAGVEIFNCPTDWLLISAVRMCGERLNDGSVLQDFGLDAPVTDVNAGLIVVWFRSDGGYVGRGFKLLYQQSAC